MFNLLPTLTHSALRNKSLFFVLPRLALASEVMRTILYFNLPMKHLPFPHKTDQILPISVFTIRCKMQFLNSSTLTDPKQAYPNTFI
jgi:hypothetical protein